MRESGHYEATKVASRNISAGIDPSKSFLLTPRLSSELSRIAFAIVGAFAITWYLWGPLAHAYWWIIDDYRWVELMASHGRITFTEMLAQFNPPDWHLGSAVNRPTYYVVHAVWCFVFGNNCLLWYLARIACFYVAAAAFWYAASGQLGVVLAGLLTFGLAVQPFWVDVVPKSVSETFSSSGSAIFLVGLSLLLENGKLTWRKQLGRRREMVAAGCIVFGGLMAIGSKENFTVLVFIAAACSLILFFIVNKSKIIMASYSIILCWGVILLYYIYRGALSTGVDLYGVSISQRLSLISTSLFRVAIPQVLLVICIALLIFLSVIHRRSGSQYVTNITSFFVVTGLQLYLVGASTFLYVFYHGAVVRIDRYSFPYAVIPLLSIAVFMMFVLQEAPSRYWTKRMQTSIGLMGTGLLMAVALKSGISTNRNAAIKYTEGTLAFRDRLARVESVLKPDPNRPLLFQSYATYDAESLASVAKYLRVARVPNPFYLSIVGYADTPDKTPMEHAMIGSTNRMIGPERTFRPGSELPAGVQPIVIVFSAPDSRPAFTSFSPLP
jgi:hypothetical protein